MPNSIPRETSPAADSTAQKKAEAVAAASASSKEVGETSKQSKPGSRKFNAAPPTPQAPAFLFLRKEVEEKAIAEQRRTALTRYAKNPESCHLLQDCSLTSRRKRSVAASATKLFERYLEAVTEDRKARALWERSNRKASGGSNND